jgi:hypothetical protein
MPALMNLQCFKATHAALNSPRAVTMTANDWDLVRHSISTVRCIKQFQKQARNTGSKHEAQKSLAVEQGIFIVRVMSFLVYTGI